MTETARIRPGLGAIEKLGPGHRTDAFDCGSPELNRFLHDFALHNQRANSAQTYVACRNDVVVGYYSLAAGSVAKAQAPDRTSRGLADHPVPIVLLARLALDCAVQRLGLGRALLRDAMCRSIHAADIAGIRALVVHAKDDDARAWYAQFDFEPSPTDPLHLFVLMKDLRRHAASGGHVP